MSTRSQARAWQGPALFSYGFKPFFLAGAVQAALMVGLSTPWLLGIIKVPSAFPTVTWQLRG
jgi:uncharacterized protein involved in response to NO